LSAAAGNIDDPRVVALSQEGHESLRDEECPERISPQRCLKPFHGECKDLLVFIEENAGIVYQRVEAIGLFGKFFGRALNAFRIGDVDLKEGNASIMSFVIELFCCRLAGLFVARTEKYAETFTGKLACYFKPDPFVCAGHKGGFLVSSHSRNCDVRL